MLAAGLWGVVFEVSALCYALEGGSHRE